MTTGCEYPGDNHSADSFTVYHGADPLTLCGYHAGRGVQAALDAIAAQPTGDECENCDALIEGGTPFTRYCDDCTDN